MRESCKGCPYQDFIYFFAYYRVDDYADAWILAAFRGVRTQFKNGNADFSLYSLDGRETAVKKSTAYMNVFMFVIRQFEDALDHCVSECMNCNKASVHAWDQGVCFYTGSIEGQDGLTNKGVLLHQLADNNCARFKTCGVVGADLEGTAKLNHDLSDLFVLGKYQLNSGNCLGARKTVRKIADRMYVPLIQGALRSAYKVDKLQGGEMEAAEGAMYAAAILPRIHAASSDAAQTIYANMRVAAPSTDVFLVKAAFESVYDELGITCDDVGGLWNKASKDYLVGMEPCSMTVAVRSTVDTGDGRTLAITMGCLFGGLFVITAALALYMRKREIQGEPIFKPSTTVDGGPKELT